MRRVAGDGDCFHSAIVSHNNATTRVKSSEGGNAKTSSGERETFDRKKVNEREEEEEGKGKSEEGRAKDVITGDGDVKYGPIPESNSICDKLDTDINVSLYESKYYESIYTCIQLYVFLIEKYIKNTIKIVNQTLCLY